MKRFKVILVVFTCILLSTAAKNAFGYFGGNSLGSYEDSVFGKLTEYNSPSFNKETLKNLEASIVTDIFGATTKEEYRAMTGGGAIAGISGLVAQVYSHPPASSKEYFADLGKSLGIAKPAYAQGTGFVKMENLLPLWKAVRNLAYVFFVIAFLYMGLAIMLRLKLDPKTVVTLQNAIPKLVIALILVTFSYAIAGLMIDLIYLMIYLGVLALQAPLQAANPAGYQITSDQLKFANLNFGDLLGTLFGAIIQGLSRTTTTAIGGTIGYALSSLGVGLAFAVTGWGVAAAAILPMLIIGVILIFLIFKLFFSLIGCYITIIISIILAPLQIVMGVFPGSEGGFSSWFKNLLANILVFPAVALAVLLGWLLTGTYGPTWSPPGLGVTGGALTPILGIGMLLLINKIPDMVKLAFKIKPAGYGTAIGQALGPAGTGWTMSAGEVVGKGGRWESKGGAWVGRAATARKIFGFRG